MAITSKNDTGVGRRYGNSQIRYGLTYVVITLVVLMFLNVYCSKTTQQIFCKSKETAMLEKCMTASLSLSELDVLNTENIQSALTKNDSLVTTRAIVTDANGQIIYDTRPETSVIPSEIATALDGNDVFSWSYSNGDMFSHAATPIISYNNLMGCVYMMEHDEAQGALLQSIQRNVLTTTIILEVVVILFSALTALIFSGKVRRILASMRIIRSGDYSHKVQLRGRDELNLLADEFNTLTDKLYVSENKRRQFVSDASHELKTPLASIKLLSDSILQNDMDMQTVQEFVGDIGQEADRLNRMSQKLLSLTRIESQEDGDCEIITVAPTLSKVVRMLSGIAKDSGITISQNIEQDSPILTLEDDLYEICYNLVENGIKYNRPGGKLNISLLQQDDNAIIQFADTGVGIPNDAVDHVFERFFRVDKARSRKSGGSGLGLAIVKNLVERNGGTIEVASELGQGSVFTVTFPIFDTEIEPETEE